jgi:hypothetical protein
MGAIDSICAGCSYPTRHSTVIMTKGYFNLRALPFSLLILLCAETQSTSFSTLNTPVPSAAALEARKAALGFLYLLLKPIYDNAA